MDAALNALIADAPAMGAISLAIVAMFAAGEVLRRKFGVAAEATRKFSHVGGGLVVFTFPWVIESAWSVAALSASFFFILLGGRISGLLGSVHAVERRTSGAELYPAAVFGTWMLSGGEALRFCVPMAVMAAADTGAALVGKSMGSARFRVMDGQRSLEGSLTFFSIAFAIFLLGLAIDGSGGWPGVLLIALIGATLTTCVEAISVRGADNLFVPWAGWLVLDRTLRLGLGEMSGWIWGMLLALVGILLAWEPARLKPAGAVAGFVFGTFAWAMGGFAWWLPLAVVAVLMVLFQPADREADLEHVFPAVVGSVAVLAWWAHSGSTNLYVPFLATVSANGGIAISRARIGATPTSGSAAFRGRMGKAVLGWLAPVAAAWAFSPTIRVEVALVAGAAGVASWPLLRRLRVPGRRLLASAFAGLLAYGLLAWR